MLNDDVVLGLDLGTTNIKCLALSTAGQVVAQSAQATPMSRPRPDWADFHPASIWQVAAETMRGVVSQLPDPECVRGIAVASLAESQVALDAKGRPLLPSIAWFDLRTTAEFAWLRDRVGYETLFQVSGMIPDAMFSLCKILWVREHYPAEYRQARLWLSFADYVAFCLCGVAATDPSLACRTLAYDLRQGIWSHQILAQADLSPNHFPSLKPSGTPLGPITREAAAATGLPRHTTVSVGMHDHMSGAFAAGGLAPEILLDSVGTSESLVTLLPQPVFAPEVAARGLLQGAISIDQPYCYLSGGIFTAGAAIDWFRREFAATEGIGELIAAASAADEAIPLFLPHLGRSMSPFPDTRAAGAFIGLKATTSRAALFRAVLEGLAFEIRMIEESMVELAHPAPFARIVTIGTTLQNRLLAQIKADVWQRVIEINPIRETVSLGAALLAGIGSGLFAGADAAAAIVKQPPILVQPDPGRSERLEDCYQHLYRDLYETLRETNHRLHASRDRDRVFQQPDLEPS